MGSPAAPTRFPLRVRESKPKGFSLAALAFTDVTMGYGDLVVFGNVDLSFEEGRIIGLIGDNGAGKTTFLRLATGLLAPISGSVELLGRSADRNDLGLLTRVGAMIETPGLYEELTVLEHLRFCYGAYQARSPLPDYSQILEEQLGRFGLTSAANKVAGRLSTGFQQRVRLARALHPWAEIVFLDEPFSGLDPSLRAELKGHLGAMRDRGTSIVFSSHALADVEQLAEEIVLLVEGRFYRFQDTAALRTVAGLTGDEDLDEVYTTLQRRLTGVDG